MPYKWEWDFGDGTTSSQQNPTKVYDVGGYDYFVKVNVTDEAGTTITSPEKRIRVNYNYPPQTPNKPTGPTSPKVGQSCVYKAYTTDNQYDGMEFGWDWDNDDVVDEWDDNNGNYYYNNDDCETPHTWDSNGIKTLKVKVRDEAGLESEWSEPLRVVVKKSRSFTFIESIFDSPIILNFFRLLRQVFNLNLS